MNNNEFEPQTNANQGQPVQPQAPVGQPVQPQNQGFNPNMNQGFNPNMNQGFNQNQGFNPNMNQGFNPNFNPNMPRKSKICAGLLAIFVGTFGVHNFYLGFKGKAITQLLVTVLSCGFGAPIIAVWALIEGIMILTSNTYLDANGQTLEG